MSPAAELAVLSGALIVCAAAVLALVLDTTVGLAPAGPTGRHRALPPFVGIVHGDPDLSARAKDIARGRDQNDLMALVDATREVPA